RPRLRDEDAVLVADAHLAGDVDPGLVGEAHPRPQLRRVAAHQVRPLVAVHADAVAHAVREVLVAGPEAGLLDHAAGGGVHGLRLDSRLRGLDGGLLRAAHHVPDAPLAIGRRPAEDARARGVARLAQPAAARAAAP